MSFENKHFMCRSCINMVKVHPLLLLPSSLFTEDVYSGTHFWKSPLCDVREGTDNSSRGWLCPQRVPCFSSPSKLVEASSKGSLPLWQTANRGLNKQFPGEVQTFFLDIWFKKSHPLEFRVKKRKQQEGPFNESSRPRWTLANILSLPEVLAPFHSGQQCSGQGLWSRLHWSHHLTLVHVTFLHSGPRFPLLSSDGVQEILMDWSCLWSFCHRCDQSNPGHCDLLPAARSLSVPRYWPTGSRVVGGVGGACPHIVYQYCLCANTSILAEGKAQTACGCGSFGVIRWFSAN